jgi:hypothetical protein
MAKYHPAARYFVLFASIIVASTVNAIEINDWLGTYDMDHDGWRGTLIISETKFECARPAWCSLALSYRDSQGNDRSARIEKMDARLQQMTFVIAFPGNRQRFTGYLFSHSPGKIAGVTYWSGKTFGFFATRKAAVGEFVRPRPGRIKEFVGQEGGPQPAPADNTVVSRTVLPSGEIERRYANGMIERISSGRIVRIMPDGSQMVMAMQQVIPAAPPQPPSKSPEAVWLRAHADSLLDIIVSLAAADKNARANYLASEGSLPNIYKTIEHRMEAIGYLSGP